LSELASCQKSSNKIVINMYFVASSMHGGSIQH